MRRNLKYVSIILAHYSIILSSQFDSPIKLCLIRVSFQEDLLPSTTGNGKFLKQGEGIDCSNYTIDNAPHDKGYFSSQIHALDSYLKSVSYGQMAIDINNSEIYPLQSFGSYELDTTMNYYNPYDSVEIQDKRLTELFRDALEKSSEESNIQFNDYDVIVVFHAGIGQDFSLPFLDPTPEDIPSTYIDKKMIEENMKDGMLIVDGNVIEHGIILPETQNHLLYDISESMFSSSEYPCEYQYGLTGTFALMMGFVIGLPPLWDISSGESRIGIFGLMDQGSNNGRGIIPSPPNPWSRFYAGWENPSIANLNQLFYLPSRSKDAVVRVNITDDEYFLIENRNNSIRENISIDSLRYVMGKNSSTEEYPSYIQVLLDSCGLQKDTNGVVINVPNYDIGLPASGLLVWHIDENIISDNIEEYSINKDISNLGINLEEADGAQDIGYPSIFLFNDPSAGYYGDMWFRGNNQYSFANPEYSGLNPVFGTNTYPSTKSNDGFDTHIEIRDIGFPKDTMTFEVSNSLVKYSLSDSSSHIKTVFDLDGDGSLDIFGGTDSIYFLIEGDISEKRYFHSLISPEYFFSFEKIGLNTDITILENISDSCLFTKYHYNAVANNINLVSQSYIDSLVVPVLNINDSLVEFKNTQDWDIHSKRVFSNSYSYGINLDNRGITIDRVGSPETGFSSRVFNYIAGIDINLDSEIEIVTIDSSGELLILNNNFSLMPRFPIGDKIKPPVLAYDLYGDDYPELFCISKDNKSMYIFDSQGKINYNIAVNENDSLIAAGNYKNNNAIFTNYKIYIFDNHKDQKGNIWAQYHADFNRNRSIQVSYEYTNQGNKVLKRGYCYPNPIKNGFGTVRIETVGGKNVDVILYNLGGYFVQKFAKNINQEGSQISEFTLNATNLESGVYFADVTISDETNTEKMLIKIAVIH